MLPWMHTNSQNYVRWPRLAILGPSHQFSGAGVLMARRGVGVGKVAPPSELSELSGLSRPLLSYLVYLDYLSYLDGAIWTIWSYLEMHTFGGQCAYSVQRMGTPTVYNSRTAVTKLHQYLRTIGVPRAC